MRRICSLSRVSTRHAATSATAGSVRTMASFAPLDTFPRRHIGPRDEEIPAMLEVTGFKTLEALCDAVVPQSIRFPEPKEFTGLPWEGKGETEALQHLESIAEMNHYHIKSYLGQGFYGTITPPVILRNILQNPGWYTAYTPYQAEISQGRMEMLLNYQTMVCDLTGMAMSNASLLDEGTAAAEALSMCHALHSETISAYFVDDDVHPTTLAVVAARAEPLGIKIFTGDAANFNFAENPVSGALLQYPSTGGRVRSDLRECIERVHAGGARAVVATDLLALTLLTPPGQMGADACVGNSQRFGVPMGCGGPHAAFLAVKDATTARRMPGRIMAVSKDRERGLPAIRMALQTREQHIRRDKATSNICTAQALLANMAAAYAIYHGPAGLRAIAERVHGLTEGMRFALQSTPGVKVLNDVTFDTVTYQLRGNRTAKKHAELMEAAGYNVRVLDERTICISLDETSSVDDVNDLIAVVRKHVGARVRIPKWQTEAPAPTLSANGSHSFMRRQDKYLQHATFHSYHSETEMMRYLFSLQSKDLSLQSAMIPLGSCTMKLNSVSEMIPVTWPQLSSLHPFAPPHQLQGTHQMAADLVEQLSSITGFDAMSLQPNSGAAGEYAGLRAIRGYQNSLGEGARDVCLIPTSAHGTNPASAVMAGLRVVQIRCTDDGYIDLAHLEKEATAHKDQLSCIMITYPSTYGVFEENVRDAIEIAHKYGGQVYMDGANMNAQVGLTSPGFLGADVCHLNLHKTFCIPHGGGGPGVGPIGVKAHLAPFLPSHPLATFHPADGSVGPVASAPLGSAAILPIPWMYLTMMGSSGLRRATQIAILNANYMRARLEKHYKVNFVSRSSNLIAHEFIIDIATFVPAGVHAEDVAKRLQDFGFHAPTMSWPVPETLMIEPTESESKQELDRFCDAMVHIRREIEDVVTGKLKAKESPLYRAPHTLRDITEGNWNRPYTIEQAVYPLPWVRQHKFWPTVNRLDNVWGDRNLFCSCDGFAKVAESKQ